MEELSEQELRQLTHEFLHAGGHLGRNISPVVRNASRGEMQVVRALSQSEGELAPGELAASAGVSTARTANILASLESKGWVERVHSTKDRRRVIVSATEKGRAEFEKRQQAGFDMALAFIKELGVDDTREFVRLLNKAACIVNKNQSKIEGACCENS